MRMIDADALMREFAEFVRASNNSDFADAPAWNDAVSLLGSAPIIEAEPIVRCKDCRYNYANMIPNGKGCQQNVYIETADTWYCADGERKEEVEE